MAIKLSKAIRKDMLSASPLSSIIEGLVLKVYAGPVPATPESGIDPSCVLLMKIDNGAPELDFPKLSTEIDAVNIQLIKSSLETWSGTATAAGTASFFRIEALDDDSSDDTANALYRIQGTIGNTVGNDWLMAQPNLALDDVRQVTTFAIKLPTF